MKKSEFSLYLSQKEGEEAAKEISLKIRTNFRQGLNFVLILFTPNYRPHSLLRILNLTLKTANLLGIKAPFLIYKDQLISKGVIGCCINKEKSQFKNFFVGEKDPAKIEHKFRQDFKETSRQKINFTSFLSPQIEPLSFLESLRLSLGKLNNFSGAGYTNKKDSTDHFMIDAGIGNGLINLNMLGVSKKISRLHNFIPLGKSFNITKLNFQQQIIHEINSRPAVEIYKKYLEEKFDIFIRNRLFYHYPLGIPSGNSFRLLSITNILEDGSFLFRGNLRYNTSANIMLLKEPCSQKILNSVFKKTEAEGLVFTISSTSRKKNLNKKCEEEIKNIQKAFAPAKEVFGIFSDYYFFSDQKTQDTNMESGGLLLNVWE